MGITAGSVIELGLTHERYSCVFLSNRPNLLMKNCPYFVTAYQVGVDYR